ncbi:MAG: hypothetical protein ACHQUC_06135 [Chlamydiales bacterium]
MFRHLLGQAVQMDTATILVATPASLFVNLVGPYVSHPAHRHASQTVHLPASRQYVHRNVGQHALLHPVHGHALLHARHARTTALLNVLLP